MTILGVAWKGDDEQYQAFLDRHDIGFIPHLRDDTGEIFSSFGVRYQPGWVFLDDDGTADVHPGALNQDELTQRIEDLLAT